MPPNSPRAFPTLTVPVVPGRYRVCRVPKAARRRSVTLDLRQVIAQVAEMSAGIAARSADYAARVDSARLAWEATWADRDRVRGKVEPAKTSWMLARPLEPPGTYPAPAAPAPPGRGGAS